jgi:hypothetical protein
MAPARENKREKRRERERAFYSLRRFTLQFISPNLNDLHFVEQESSLSRIKLSLCRLSVDHVPMSGKITNCSVYFRQEREREKSEAEREREEKI